MKCPHCDKPMYLPEAARRNMETYRGHVNVVTGCCGNMVIAYPVTAFHGRGDRRDRPRRVLVRSDHRTRGTDQKLGMGAVAAYMDAHFLWC